MCECQELDCAVIITQVIFRKMSLYSVIHRIESGFNIEKCVHWASNYWTVSLYLSAAYLVMVFGGRLWMKNRPAFDLRRPLCMWNTGLAAFSILGTVILVPNLFHRIYTMGMANSVCFSDTLVVPQLGLWGFLFGLSKVVELGDTAFIVLRKTPLPFLHWFHHTTVFVYTWYTLREPSAVSHWYGGINYFVHSIMYSYYAIRASGRRVPSKIALVITLVQLMQMFLGAYVNLLAFATKYGGQECILRDDMLYPTLVLYSLYAALFMNYFYQRYIKKTK